MAGSDKHSRKDLLYDLLRHVQAGVVIHTADTRILAVNPKACELLGLTEKKLLGVDAQSKVWHFISDDGSLIKPEGYPVNRAIREKKIVRDMVAGINRPGRKGLVWVLANADPVFSDNGTIERVVVTFMDITDWKLSEEALRESEEKYRILAEASPEMIYFIDSNGVVQYVNTAGLGMFNAGGDGVIGKNISEIFPPDLAKRHMQAIRRVVSTGQIHRAEIAEQFPRGTRWIDVRLSPVRNSAGAIVGVLGLSQDITERKNAEDALRSSEERYRSIVEHVNDALYIHDLKGTILDCNDNACKMVGYSREELVGSHLAKIDSLQERDQLKQRTEYIINHGSLVFDGEHIRKDGTPVAINVSATLVSKEGNGIVHSFVRDCTDLRKMEAELQKAQKLEALGVLAGGIAHDFNNLLGGVFGFIDLARLSLKPEDPATEYLNMAYVAFERAKGLSMQLLTFAKGGAPIKKVLSIASMLRESCILALSGSNIRYTCNIPNNLASIEGDEYQLAQVFSNILINARQAMPDGGMVTLSAENRTIKERDGIPVPAGKYLVVSIQDEGIGIPQKIVDRIFDPFFTTKQQGSGLGLAISYSIVKRHGGHIEVTATSTGGSTITTYLPASDVDAVESPETIDTGLLKGSERILVMDDETSVREAVVRILRSFGYTVQAVADGTEALDKYRNSLETNTPFNLVILDLTVPGGMGGEKTLAELRKIDPEVVAVVSSGYADNAILSNPEAHGFKGMITKPFRAAEMLQTVKRILQGKRVSRV